MDRDRRRAGRRRDRVLGEEVTVRTAGRGLELVPTVAAPNVTHLKFAKR